MRGPHRAGREYDARRVHVAIRWRFLTSKSPVWAIGGIGSSERASGVDRKSDARYLTNRTGSPSTVASQVVMSETFVPDGNVTTTWYQQPDALA